MIAEKTITSNSPVFTAVPTYMLLIWSVMLSIRDITSTGVPPLCVCSCEAHWLTLLSLLYTQTDRLSSKKVSIPVLYLVGWLTTEKNTFTRGIAGTM